MYKFVNTKVLTEIKKSKFGNKLIKINVYEQMLVVTLIVVERLKPLGGV